MNVKAWFIAIGVAILGFVLGILGRKSTRQNDIIRDIEGIEDELGRERVRIESERDLSRNERIAIERERAVVDRDRELIEELKRRIAEDELA